MVERIGRYEVKAELGRGGFGRVFKAFDPTVGRLVAIKTLHAGGDRELIVRFRNEAAAAGKLRHRNIIVIHDYGEYDAEPYIVMEFLEGEDLQRVIHARRPLTLLQKVRIMGQVAEGLQHAHQNGVIHRDVKPANMMLLPDSTVKIMDFGIAFVSQITGTRLTKTGATPGTLKYMAPEQFRGETNDALSDMFSFGVCYYELVSGHHPFDGPTQPSLMFNIMQGEPKPLHELIEGFPEALDSVILRCLSKERDLRYSSFDDLLLDVRPILSDLQRDEAQALFFNAELLVESGQRDQAEAKLRQALEVDPSNRDARRLLDTLHKQAIGPKVDALISAGRQHLDARNFTDAINSFEAALKLDRTNRDVISLVTQARATRQQVTAAAKLVVEASIALSQRDLTRSHHVLDQAIAADPANPDASRLRNELHAQLATREVEARAARLEQDRKDRISSVIRESTDLLNAGNITGAIQILDVLKKDEPDSAVVERALAHAREQRDARKRQETIDRLFREVDALVKTRSFDRAIEMLRIGLGYYPSDPAILEHLSAVEAAHAAFLRDRDLRYTQPVAPSQEVVYQQPATHDEAIQESIEPAPSGSKKPWRLVMLGVPVIIAAAAIGVALHSRTTKPPETPSAPVARSAPATTSARAPSNPPAADPVRAATTLPAAQNSVVANQPADTQKPVRPAAPRTENVIPPRSVATVPAVPKLDPKVAIAQDWERLKASKDITQLEAFARANSGNEFAKAAADRVQELRWELVDRKNAAALRDYVTNNSGSPYVAAAKDTLARLEWDAVDKNNLKALQDFRDRYPQGELGTRAAREIERLEQKAQAERAAAEDRLQADQRKADRDAVLQVLSRFTASISDKNLDAMTAAFPGVPKDAWRQAFSRSRSISMTLRPIADPQFTASGASVECEQATRTDSAGREVKSPTRKVRVSLAKRGGAWIISHIE